MQQNPENALIGDLLADSGCLRNIRRFVPDSAMFADKKAAKIYRAILELVDERGAFDIPLIGEKIVRDGIPSSELIPFDAMGLPSMAEHHAKLVAEGHMKRETSKALTSVVAELNNGGDVLNAIDATTSVLSDLKCCFQREKTVHISHVVQEACDELDDIISGKRAVGIPFGLVVLDKVTGGMENGDLVVVAAPEKSGKSTLMIQIAFHNAALGVPCLIFSSEMLRTQILYRKALMDTGIRWIDVKHAAMSKGQSEALIRKMQDLARLPIFIRHGVFSLADITSESERYVQDKGIGLIAVDYIQRVVPKATKGDNREREVAAISSGLKSLALEYNLPVLALSQVNDDLRARESRAIEQDMDKMITIDRRPEPLSEGTIVEVSIKLRQRMGLSGEMGDSKLRYDRTQGIWLD